MNTYMLATVLAFIDAHPRAIPSTLAALVVLGRAIAARYGDAIKHRFPKAAALAEALAHLSPDIVKAGAAILRAWKPGLLGVLAVLAVGCSHPYTPAETTLVAVHAAGHGLVAADHVVALRCGTSSPSPECGRFVAAYTVLRSSLLVAERAASEWRRVGDAASQCRAHVALEGAKQDLDAVFALLASLHAEVPAEVVDASHTIAAIAASLAPACPGGQ